MLGNVSLIIATSIRIISNPFSNVFQKTLTKKGQAPLMVNLISYTLLSFIALFFIDYKSIPTLSNNFWLYVVLGGLTGALGNGFIIMALEKEDLSILGPINAYKSVVGMIVAFILIREIPNQFGLLGIALIIAGSYFVLDQGTEKWSWSIFKKKGIQYRIWGLLLTGIEAVFDKQVILQSSIKWAFIGWAIFGAIFSLLFILFVNKDLLKGAKKMDATIVGYYLLLITCVGLMIVTTNYVFREIQVSYGLALFQLSILLSVILGYRIFNETNLIKKLIGATIMISGSLLIILLK
jgi:drug/metabolite transporter (DMT)-like permease